MGEIPIIELDQKDPQLRGRAYGEAAREIIREIIGIYGTRLAEMTGESFREAAGRLGPYVDAAERRFPELVAEVVGIAEGAGLDFESIFLLNCRSELLFRGIAAEAGECSALAVLPPAAYGEETIIAQNWDWFSEVKALQVILKIAGRGSIPPLVTFTEAGQLAKMGMNGAGIGLVVNNLSADKRRVGVPWIFITRKILESTRLTEAIGAVLSTPRGHSINFLIAAGQEAVNLETSPVESHVMWPENGILVHTNHFLGPCLNFRDIKGEIDPTPHTYNRFRRLSRRITEASGSIDDNVVKAALRDHFDHPFSVCLHDNPARGLAGGASTCLSLVMTPNAGRIDYAPGNPCECEYRRIDVPFSERL